MSSFSASSRTVMPSVIVISRGSRLTGATGSTALRVARTDACSRTNWMQFRSPSAYLFSISGRPRAAGLTRVERFSWLRLWELPRRRRRNRSLVVATTGLSPLPGRCGNREGGPPGRVARRTTGTALRSTARTILSLERQPGRIPCGALGRGCPGRRGRDGTQPVALRGRCAGRCRCRAMAAGRAPERARGRAPSEGRRGTPGRGRRRRRGGRCGHRQPLAPQMPPVAGCAVVGRAGAARRCGSWQLPRGMPQERAGATAGSSTAGAGASGAMRAQAAQRSVGGRGGAGARCCQPRLVRSLGLRSRLGCFRFFGLFARPSRGSASAPIRRDRCQSSSNASSFR